MKRFLTYVSLSLLLAAVASTALAQRIAYNERTPRLKLKNRPWLCDSVPETGDYAYIGFIDSRSNTCMEFCNIVKRQLERMDNPPTVIFITREDADKTNPALKECLGGRIGAVSDGEGEIFRNFGVRYVPFGVLVDNRRRAVWFGNPLTSDKDLLRNMTPDTSKKRKMRWLNIPK